MSEFDEFAPEPLAIFLDNDNEKEAKDGSTPVELSEVLSIPAAELKVADEVSVPILNKNDLDVITYSENLLNVESSDPDVEVTSSVKKVKEYYAEDYSHNAMLFFRIGVILFIAYAFFEVFFN